MSQYWVFSSVISVIAALLLISCTGSSLPGIDPSNSLSEHQTANGNLLSTEELLKESWEVYKQRFIQPDGRVIDREDGDRTVSEGQAYAMLRAVMIDDSATFALTLNWAENNLRRETPEGELSDRLWAWKWGQDHHSNDLDDLEEWSIIDANFASDADIDAITALILAARQWDQPEYLDLATLKLEDLWELSTLEVADRSGMEDSSSEPEPQDSPGLRYLLPGPAESFHPQDNLIYLNPSYLAPYAFRLFAQVDPDRDWLSLVDSSYQILDASFQQSPVGLPGDWIGFDREQGAFLKVQSPDLQSIYGFDAYRVWWRVALDAVWFDEPRAIEYLQTHLRFLEDQWRSHQAIVAQYDLDGNPLVDYESTAQYGMLYAAFRVTDRAIADEIKTQKLIPPYRDGVWDHDSAYYTHNLSWFGIYSAADVMKPLLEP